MTGYEDLLERYAAPLRRLAWAYTRGGNEGDDLFQEIALALWTALPRFRGEASERTWVYRIAHNRALSFQGERRRRAWKEMPADHLPDPSPEGDSEAAAIGRQRRELLLETVRELPWPDRQMITLYLEGLSAAEMEAITGLSQGNVATRLTRIRQRLARQLREREAR